MYGKKLVVINKNKETIEGKFRSRINCHIIGEPGKK